MWLARVSQGVTRHLRQPRASGGTCEICWQQQSAEIMQKACHQLCHDSRERARQRRSRASWPHDPLSMATQEVETGTSSAPACTSPFGSLGGLRTFADLSIESNSTIHFSLLYINTLYVALYNRRRLPLPSVRSKAVPQAATGWRQTMKAFRQLVRSCPSLSKPSRRQTCPTAAGNLRRICMVWQALANRLAS